MKRVAVSLAGFLLSTLAAAQVAQVDPNSVTYTGDGCLPGTVDYDVTNDGKLDVNFFGNSAITDQFNLLTTRGCVLKMRVDALPGYRIAASKITITGQANIASSGSGTASVKLARIGDPELSAGKVFPSGYANSFAVDSLPANQLHFSECGGSLNLKVRTQVLAQRSQFDDLQSAVILEDAITGKPFALRCPFIVQPCP